MLRRLPHLLSPVASSSSLSSSRLLLLPTVPYNAHASSLTPRRWSTNATQPTNSSPDTSHDHTRCSHSCKSNSNMAGNSNGKVEAPKTGWKGNIPSQKGGSEEGYILKPPYYWHSDDFDVKYRSSCWCGRIKFEFHGDPITAKHCHCSQCQVLHGAPFQYAAVFHKTSVRLSHQTDPTNLNFFSTHRKEDGHDVPCKIACSHCHSPLLDEGRNMVMAYPSTFNFKDGQIPASFASKGHIFYSEAIVEFDDGVPKWSGHIDSSERLPHKIGRQGKLGLGQSGQEGRGEKRTVNEEHASASDKKAAKGETGQRASKSDDA